MKLTDFCLFQGCCNNLTFGIDSKTDPETGEKISGFGYYETIAGGGGAGERWKGESGVHCMMKRDPPFRGKPKLKKKQLISHPSTAHMTNTRITDPEILEKRYPTLLRQFTLRPGSGGKGQHNGGEGVIRDIEFLTPMQVSILSERRVYHPYGLAGGEKAQNGLNLWIMRDRELGEEIRQLNIGGKNTVPVRAHDRVVVMTAGGGGWGKPGLV